MAITITNVIYEALFRFHTSGADVGKVGGISTANVRQIWDGSTLESDAVLSPASVDFAGLALAMHDDDLAALKIAVDAEIASRL